MLRWSALAVVLLLAVGLGWFVFAGTTPGANDPHERDGGTTGPNTIAVGERTRTRPQGGVYRWPWSEPQTLNLFTVSDYYAKTGVLWFTHEPLVDVDPETGVLRAAVASRFEQSKDGREMEFALRDDARFADGSPVTLDDVLFTWRTAKALVDHPGGELVRSVAPTDALFRTGERSFRVTTTEPHFATLGAFATTFRIVQARHFFDRVAAIARADGVEPPADGTPRFVELVAKVQDSGPGTGPLRMSRNADGVGIRSAGVSLKLSRNDACWRRAAQPDAWNLDRHELLFIGDTDAQFTALKRGDVDWFFVTGDPTAMLERHTDLDANYVLHNYDAQHYGHYYVAWNCRRPGLDRAEVRRALTMLFDRQGVVDAILRGAGRVAAGWFKPGRPEYPSFAPHAHDVPAARALLAEAGYDGRDRRFAVTIDYVDTGPMRRILELSRPAFDAAGVDLTLRSREFPLLLEQRNTGEFDGLLFLHNHDAFPDPSDEFGPDNIMGWSNARSNELLTRARRTTDADERTALWQEWNRILHDEQPHSLLLHRRGVMLLHRRFQDARPGVRGMWPEKWWVRPEDRLR